MTSLLVRVALPAVVVIAVAGAGWWMAVDRDPVKVAESSTPPTESSNAATQPAPGSNPSGKERPAPPPHPHELEPIDILPVEQIVSWYGRKLPEAPAPGEGLSQIELALAAASSLIGDRVDPGARLGLRILQSMGQMIRYPHAIALLDTSAKHAGRHPDSRQLDQAEIVFVIQTESRSGPFGQLIQDTLYEQTSDESTQLNQLTAEKWRYFQLIDKRLPNWVEVAWGEIGPFFVLTVGRDVWPKIAEVAAGKRGSLGRDSWLVKQREDRGQDALIEIYLDPEQMKKLDPVLHGSVSEFFKAWGAEQMSRAHWALGLEGEILYCHAHFEINGDTVTRRYADPSYVTPETLRIMPEGYRQAVYRMPAGDFIYRLIHSLYVWQAPNNRARAYQLWRKIQQDYDFDAQKDVLDNLGDTIILHNYPTHPLKLPLFFTTVIEIERDNAHVRETINRLCAAWQEALERNEEEMPIENPAKLRRDGDVWHVEIGPVISPLAWTVTDRYIVISWSYTALSDYLAEMGSVLK
jgi:hypothetical protein